MFLTVSDSSKPCTTVSSTVLHGNKPCTTVSFAVPHGNKPCTTVSFTVSKNAFSDYCWGATSSKSEAIGPSRPISFSFELISFHFELISFHFEMSSLHFQLISFYFQLISFHFESISFHFENETEPKLCPTVSSVVSGTNRVQPCPPLRLAKTVYNRVLNRPS